MVSTGGMYPTDKDLYDSLKGVINPDIIIGLINGQIIADDTILTTVDKGDYLSIRLITRHKTIIEIRYVEEVMSRFREIQLMQQILGAIEWKERLRETPRKFIAPIRKTKNKSGSHRKGKIKQKPKITILEMEKIYKRMSETTRKRSENNFPE